MIEPRPACTISRAAACEHRKVPLTLIAMQRSQSSSVEVSTEPLLLVPALLYSTSTWPNSPTSWSKAAVTWAC